MASTPEKKVKDAVAKILKEYGAYYFYPATGGFGRSGVFDIVICLKGYFIGVECKATCKNAPTLLQSRNATHAKTANGLVLLVHNGNIPEFRATIERIYNGESVGFIGESIWPFDGVIDSKINTP